MKPYDEGYFVADATGATFHLHQLRGKPDIRRVSSLASPEDKPKWEALKPLYFHVQEQDNREVHTIIVDKTNQAWFVVGKNYHLVPIPLKNYNPARMSLVVRGDLINRLVTVTGGKWTTYREMAEQVVNLATRLGNLPVRPSPTADLRLHGAGENNRTVYGDDETAMLASGPATPSIAPVVPNSSLCLDSLRSAA